MPQVTALEALLSAPIEALALPALRSGDPDPWDGHVAFAHWLIPVVQPRILVELATWPGVSYAAFCNAVSACNLETRCFGVGRWHEDGNNELHRDDPSLDFQRFNEINFARFSELLRCEPGAALSRFEDCSVDLLHITGFQTYGDVRLAFETWAPKLSERAVVLIHNVAPVDQAHDMRRYWAELGERLPSFCFVHSAGLGVLLVGPNTNLTLRGLCALEGTERGKLIEQRFEKQSLHARRIAPAIGEIEPRPHRIEHVANALGSIEDEAILQDWVRTEVGPWLGRRLPTFDVHAHYAELNATCGNTFIFSFDNGKVTVGEKPDLGPGSEHARDRANGYRIWFAGVAERFLQDCSITLAVYVGDGAPENPAIPVFSFQKPTGNRCLLLPDPDIQGLGFPKADDRRRFDQKNCRAIFAGATSGGLISKSALVADGAVPRVRAALHFRDNPDVDFLLPVIVQCEDAETVDILRGMGFGSGQTVSFADQLANKFVISMDGNGASCTRVSITLQSNSVLLKFDSPHQLCYFGGLRPWTHYIPVVSYDDVAAVIEQERRSPGTFEPITKNAQDFAARFLTREALLHYTAMLLREYARALNVFAMADRVVAQPKLMVHVEDIGDCWANDDGWAGIPGSALAVEGILVELGDRSSGLSLSCQVLSQERVLSNPAASGTFCGTIGARRPLLGFRVQIMEATPSSPKLQCWARFIDGSSIGPVPGGTLCCADNHAPLEALKLRIVAA